jgi:hypothetical protein
MTVSAAKLEANRRNAMRSCGPRTQSGKDRSKLNAVKHGMRAATLVLLDEDAQALDDRKADWAASLMPRGAAEQQIVDDAVEYTWLRDRARRAQEARLATNIVNAGVDEAIREADEVLRLGQKLFWDERGPLANYPHYDREEDGEPRVRALGFRIRSCRRSRRPPAPGAAPASDGRRLPVDARPLVRAAVDS